MKTKSLWLGLLIGLAIGVCAAYLYFVSVTASAAGQKVFGWIGGSVGIVASLAYFCRTYVQHLLGIQAEQKKVRFSRTYELRANAISEAHGKFLDLYEAVDEFQFRGGRDTNSAQWHEAIHRINAARNSLIDFLSRKQLYLPKTTTAKIRDLFQRVYGSHLRYTLLQEESDPQQRGLDVKKWLAERDEMRNYLTLLEEDFRDALGFLD